MSHDELKLIQWLRARPNRHSHLKLGIGDDMAIVDADSASVLFACDMLLDGVHFDTRRHSLELIGRKAAACNLSDCAAMAVQPRAMTLSVALPEALSTSDAVRLMDAVAKIADDFGAPLAGGDTNRWSGPLVLDVAVLAVPFPGLPPCTRSGARLGDKLFVTDTLGGSLEGKHLTFTPRVREARDLAQSLGSSLHAMMDVTDGLSLDLWRMCQASGVGAILDEALLESAASQDAHVAAERDSRSVLDHVLSDGEDFELLLACDAVRPGTQVPLLQVGHIVDSGFSLRRRSGLLEPLEPRGYIH